MVAIELHIGSPVYSVSASEIREYNVNRISLIRGKVNIICGSNNPEIKFENVEPDATQAIGERYGKKTYYFNLDDAQKAQQAERERDIKCSFELVEKYQKQYQNLVEKYLFAEPSKPVKE